MLLDEQAEILAWIDTLAEQMRKSGGTTIRSIGHISQLQSLRDNDTDFVPPEQMIKRMRDATTSPMSKMTMQ